MDKTNTEQQDAIATPAKVNKLNKKEYSENENKIIMLMINPTHEKLEEYGFKKHDKTPKGTFWKFPKELENDIPDGVKVYDVELKEFKFSKAKRKKGQIIFLLSE